MLKKSTPKIDIVGTTQNPKCSHKGSPKDNCLIGINLHFIFLPSTIVNLNSIQNILTAENQAITTFLLVSFWVYGFLYNP